MRVLIVDDSLVVWRRLFDMLKDLSAVSFLAYSRNLSEARRYLAGVGPDLLVLDISLPDGSGLDLLQDVRLRGLGTKVAIFSNLSELRRVSLDLGADWYFDKSMDYPQLLSLIEDRAYWAEQHTGRGGTNDAEF
ncbi:response regulator receiver and unknown domain protein [Thiorhodococcus drewsii AZ1]|uniref:Response regulatory domain-containing protein n=1 Tax=Thiorhodococcus drewsii AZ1 TaxID=765913 RepID=G2DY49_9GAMM|nr:response regulator [Thiorhodococcus drewsii]EGV32841.1 response regulator receiver and unknown domain protein [Thiorhodococcus drewsii AZ1]